MQNVVVQFKGFSPATKTKKFFDDLAMELKEEGPKSSVTRLTIIKEHEEFKANIQMSSHAGPIFVTIHATHLHELSHGLVARVRKQLGRWKDARQHHQSLRDISQEAA